MNTADIIIVALIAILVIRVIVRIIKNKGNNCSCGGNCSSCGMTGCTTRNEPIDVDKMNTKDKEF